MSHQPKLHYEDLDDALHDLVQMLGGFKKAGARLWPGTPQDDAAQRLRHCLNKSRREKLDHHEQLTLLNWGREIGFHGAKHYIDDATGYQRGEPVNPKDEERKAIEAVESAAQALQRATDALILARQRVAPAATGAQFAVVK